MWVRIPLVPVEANNTRLVILPAVCKAAVGKRGGGRRKVQFLHKPLEKMKTRLVRLTVRMPALHAGDGGFKSPTRYCVRMPKVQKPMSKGRSDDQISMPAVSASVCVGHWSLGLGHLSRRVCGCGHRGGLKNRRSWFDSNILHWESGISDLRSQISTRSRSSSWLRTLAPQAGNAGFKARTGQSEM